MRCYSSTPSPGRGGCNWKRAYVDLRHLLILPGAAVLALAPGQRRARRVHHFALIYALPAWVFPDAANLGRVGLHGAVVAMPMTAFVPFVFIIVNLRADAYADERVAIAIADTGMGIAPEHC